MVTWCRYAFADPLLLLCVVVLFPLKGNGRNLSWFWAGSECSCLLQLNEPPLNKFWNLHFDADALGFYTCPLWSDVDQSSNLWLFFTPRQNGYLPEKNFCSYLLKVLTFYVKCKSLWRCQSEPFFLTASIKRFSTLKELGELLTGSPPWDFARESML